MALSRVENAASIEAPFDGLLSSEKRSFLDERNHLEIFESGCTKHPVGQKFRCEEDAGKKCPWLLGSANTMIRVVKFDVGLGLSYKGASYERGIKEDDVTTEFVRCPDPTSAGVVLKITARKRTRGKA
ncbi:MAG: hypothetical protein ACFFFD_14760 [Promethearchaeota archaeon]